MLVLLIISILLVGARGDELNGNSNEDPKKGKALSVFQVVRFPNIACVGSTSLNGTCYTASECISKGGTNSGSCANGFGVCCTFILGCGSRIAENCTYFQSSGAVAGLCSVQICKCSPDICQLRLDFNTFAISGPSTVTITQVRITNGAAISTATAGPSANYATSCLTDNFSVTGTGQSPPVICGTNTGYHMYTDASNSCNTLSFQLGQTGIGTTLATRQWNIKISQISCLSQWLPPPGCTQYFTGTSNVINSYNYAGGSQLANQIQNVCMRRERGYCRLCVTQSTQTSTDFQISAKDAIAIGYMTSKCCGYGLDGLQTFGFDCLVVPGAAKMATPFTQIGNGFCGKLLVDGTSATMSATVCTFQQPFNVQFLTDAYTYATRTADAAGATILNAPAATGFRLTYFQTTC